MTHSLGYKDKTARPGAREDWCTPKRGNLRDVRAPRSVVECGSLLPLWLRGRRQRHGSLRQAVTQPGRAVLGPQACRGRAIRQGLCALVTGTETRNAMFRCSEFITIVALSVVLAASGDTQAPGTAGTELPFDKMSKADLNNYRVRLSTSLGDIEIDLFPHFAPAHVRNFLNLAKLGLYGGTAWHRVVPRFVIQGGEIGTRLPPVSMEDRAQFVRRMKPEFNRLEHEEGTVSMARAEAEDSAETSFFICLARQKSLDEKYTIFGKVVSGMEVVKKIAAVKLGKNDQPKKRIDILRAEVLGTAP